MEYFDFIKKYGDIEVKFDSYYKYVFAFTDGKGLVVYVGGNKDDIYRFPVNVMQKYKIRDIGLEPHKAILNAKTIGEWDFW